MKRLSFLLLSVLLMTGTLLAWSYSTNTTWNGSIHVAGSTSFTPPSTTAYVRMGAPDLSSSCPVCDQDPGVYREYYAKARLKNPTGTSYTAQRQCGGCATTTGTVTTTETWTLWAEINETCVHSDVQESSWGPVNAYASSTQFNCNQSGPGE